MNFRGILNATLGRFVLPSKASDVTSPEEGELWVKSGKVRANLDSSVEDVLTTAELGAASGVCPLDSNSLVPEANLPAVATGSVPTGTIVDFAGYTAPSGFAFCNGASLTRAGAYSALFSAITFQRAITYISTKNYHVSAAEGVAGFYVGMRVEIDGTADTIATIDTVGNNFTVSTIDSLSAALARCLPWGAADLVTFKLPDLRRRTTIGAGGTVVNTGTGTVGNAVGQTGGEEEHQLTTAEMPEHAHSAYHPSGSSYNWASGGGVPAGASTGTAGSDDSHNNMQPSATVNKIIKV